MYALLIKQQNKYHFPIYSKANGPCPLENLILHLSSLIFCIVSLNSADKSL